MSGRTISQPIRDVMRQVIGLTDANPDDELHFRLAQAIYEVGQHASYGQQIVAIRWVFNWALRDAGSRFAASRAVYERRLDLRKLELFATNEKLALGKAEVMANADDEVYRLKLEYLLAEQEERAMRKFLDTLAAALDNHRTDRADMRGGDRAAAQGYGGGA